MNKRLEWVLDRIWPNVYDKEPEPQTPPPAIPDSECLDQATKEVDNLVIQAGERIKVVERKTMSLMTFGSVAASVIIAGTIGMASLEIPANDWTLKTLATAAVALGAYIAIQLLIVVINATAGLSARPYSRQTTESVIPTLDERIGTYQRRQMASKINALRRNEWQINRKVEKMNVAHVALRNAGVAAVALAFTVSATALFTILI